MSPKPKGTVVLFQAKAIRFSLIIQKRKDAFLKKLSDIEQNLERNFKKKEYDEKYERLLNLLEKENLFLKDGIRRKDTVVNTLLDNISNRVPEHSNYIMSKNTDVSTQTEHRTKNSIQTSTAGNNHCTIIAGEKKKKDKNRKKLNINKLNSSTWDKTHVNNSNKKRRESLWIRMIKNLKVMKLRSKSISTL